jgi:hypothetical protein
MPKAVLKRMDLQMLGRVGERFVDGRTRRTGFLDAVEAGVGGRQGSDLQLGPTASVGEMPIDEFV